MSSERSAADVLVHCLATRFGATPDPALLAVSPSTWNGVVTEAKRQWLAALAHDSIRALGANAHPPKAVLDQLRRIYLHHSFRNRILLRELEVVLAALRAREIDAALLKGVDLITTVYADPGVRGMTDIDLLVRRDRLADAESVLVSLGYGPLPRPDMESYLRRTNHIAPFKKKDAVPIEVHWTIERATSPFAIDAEQLWTHARRVRVGEVEVLHLAPEHMILHLALHVSYHHGYARAGLKTLCDIAATVKRHGPELDWKLLCGEANRAGAGRFVYTAVELARTLLDAPIPPHAVAGFQHDAEDDAIVDAARPFMLTPPVELPGTLLENRPVERPRENVRRFLAGIFPPPNRLREIYGLPGGSHFTLLYYLFRPFDLLVRRGRVIFQFLFRSRALQPTLVWRESQRRISRWVEGASPGTRD